jgi:hypothetical protein
MIGDKNWKLTNVVRVRLAPHSTHSQRQTTFPGNWNCFFQSVGPVPNFIFSFVRQEAGPVPFSTGGRGVTSNHDKEAHRGSHPLFYSLI